jgi:hypothetical protein
MQTAPSADDVVPAMAGQVLHVLKGGPRVIRGGLHQVSCSEL